MLVSILLASAASIMAASGIAPQQVVILFNSAVPESRELAEIYAAARSIPANRLVGLPMPDKADISQKQYLDHIRDPLRKHFDRERLWQRGYDGDSGVTLPVKNEIRLIVSMRGVPLRIKPTPKAEGAPPPDPENPIAGRDEAAVDSELAMFGVDGVPTDGILQNRYFQSERPFSQEPMPFMVLTGRIDAHSLAVCQRMISDAILTEKTGLWGMAYVDIANKFPQGDAWLEAIIEANRTVGIPTVIDRLAPTLPTHYPMHDAALYYGWYDHQVSGPFLNPHFRFRRGAIAVHIHSFSAARIDSAASQWCAPLLASGAAATVGNVHEPYLHLSHNLDVMHDRLLRGFTFIEAAWAAVPCASWQAVAIGDPLYRPFANFPAGGDVADSDLDFRALAMAKKTWPTDDAERRNQLTQAVERTQSGTLAEALALESLAAKDRAHADTWLARAATLHTSHVDQMRIAFHQAAMRSEAKDIPGALEILRAAASRHAGKPEVAALDAWIARLDPPPAPAKPTN